MIAVFMIRGGRLVRRVAIEQYLDLASDVERGEEGTEYN